MSEIKCYSLDIPIEQFFKGSVFAPDEEMMLLPTKCGGYLGVNIDQMRGISHHLYATTKHRIKAYQKLKDKLVCFINMTPAYVDERYLK